MPRVGQDKAYRTFTGGFVTETTKLGFPENSCQDIDNCTIEIKGSVRRRLGLEQEALTYFVPATNYYSADHAHNRFKWNNPGGVNELDFEVVQNGRYLTFFIDGLEYITGVKGFNVDLVTYKVSTATTTNVENSDIDVSTVKGKLMVVGKYIEPLLINYFSATDTISVQKVVVKERDFEGVNDGLAVDARPTVNDSFHLYNLKNQGWTDTYITNWHTARPADYPSNADIQSLGYNSVRAWSAADITTYDTNSPAPKGHLIRQVFNTNKVENYLTTFTNNSFSPLATSAFFNTPVLITVSTVTAHGFSIGNEVQLTGSSYFTPTDGADKFRVSYDGNYIIIDTPTPTTYTIMAVPVPNATFDTGFVGIEACGHSTSSIDVTLGYIEDTRFTTTAVFAGRVWYAGVESPRLNDSIFFSQTIETDDNFPRCYQRQDPTAEQLNDLLATDGGRLKIQGMGQVRKLLPTSEYLLVFTSLGVWAIGPGSDGEFKATSFSIRKLASPGCSSRQSVLSAEGVPFFWSTSGIFAILEDSTTGFLTVKNLTAETIQTYYNGLSDEAVNKAAGVYDDNRKRIYWIHKDTTGVLSEILVINIQTSAFYKWSLPVSGNVVPLGISAVRLFAPEGNKIKILYKDVSSGNTVYSWAQFNNTDFVDFNGSSIGATDFESYIVTSQETLGDLQRNKQATFLHSFFQRTETGFELVGSDLVALNPSGCTVVAQWDWNNTGSGGRWSDSQAAYRYRRPYFPSGTGDTFDTGEEIVYTKLKIRGKGRSLALRYASVSGKDFQLLGYSIPYTANEV